MEHLSSITTPNRIQISPFGL